MRLHVGAPASCPSVSVFEAAKYSEVAVFAKLNAMLAAPLCNALVPSIGPGFTGFFVCVQMKGAELQVQLTQYLLNCADAHTQLAAGSLQLDGEIANGLSQKLPMAQAGGRLFP